jgi:hypothetical protein
MFNHLILTSMKDIIFQIQIVLRGSKPKIWRRVLIPSDMSLADFHEVIQTSMGWENSHLHYFEKNNTFYTLKIEGDDFLDENNKIDYRDLTVADLLTKKHDRITYEYDYGDRWEHDIFLEDITTVNPQIKYPVCIEGKMSCPPEDCGGINGYHDILFILKNPQHKYYENYKDWLDERFDPEYFNIDEVNRRLHY